MKDTGPRGFRDQHWGITEAPRPIPYPGPCAVVKSNWHDATLTSLSHRTAEWRQKATREIFRATGVLFKIQ